MSNEAETRNESLVFLHYAKECYALKVSAKTSKALINRPFNLYETEQS